MVGGVKAVQVLFLVCLMCTQVTTAPTPITNTDVVRAQGKIGVREAVQQIGLILASLGTTGKADTTIKEDTSETSENKENVSVGGYIDTLKSMLKALPSTGNEVVDIYIKSWVYVLLSLAACLSLLLLVVVFSVGRNVFQKFKTKPGQTNWHVWSLFMVPIMGYYLVSGIGIAAIYFAITTIALQVMGLTGKIKDLSNVDLATVFSEGITELVRGVKTVIQPLESAALEAIKGIQSDSHDIRDQLKDLDLAGMLAETKQLKRSITELVKAIKIMSKNLERSPDGSRLLGGAKAGANSGGNAAGGLASDSGVNDVDTPDAPTVAVPEPDISSPFVSRHDLVQDGLVKAVDATKDPGTSVVFELNPIRSA